MRKLILLPAATLVAATLPAQPDHFSSSPAGFEGVEGNTSVDLIGREPLLRFQQADATNLGSKHDRNRWAFRRDGLLPDNLAYGSRTVELELSLGETQLGSLSTSFDSNYIAGTKAVVLSQKKVSFPDWTFAPAVAPQGEPEWVFLYLDNIVPGYAGKVATGTDWLWEVRVFSNDKGGQPYPMDADSALVTQVQGLSASLGSGCITSGQTSGLSHAANFFNLGTAFSALFDVRRAAANQPAALLLGAQGGPFTLPGFCTNIEVLPLIAVPMGNTDGTGFAMLSLPSIAYQASMIGQDFYSQAVTADPSQSGVQLALSNGRKVTVPWNPPAGSQCKHLWALDPNAATATSGLVDGGIIALTNHP